MSRAKEGSRTLTGVTPLEPERTGLVRKVRELLRVGLCSSTQKASWFRTGDPNNGARTGILIPKFRWLIDRRAFAAFSTIPAKATGAVAFRCDGPGGVTPPPPESDDDVMCALRRSVPGAS